MFGGIGDMFGDVVGGLAGAIFGEEVGKWVNEIADVGFNVATGNWAGAIAEAGDVFELAGVDLPFQEAFNFAKSLGSGDFGSMLQNGAGLLSELGVQVPDLPTDLSLGGLAEWGAQELGLPPELAGAITDPSQFANAGLDTLLNFAGEQTGLPIQQVADFAGGLIN
ncbi:MAG: hypothetical protein AAF772_17010 [Acidobacteriota bacterium]